MRFLLLCDPPLVAQPIKETAAQQKQNPRFRECYTCFGCEAKTGVVRILIIF